jgi:hypothetical protein
VYLTPEASGKLDGLCVSRAVKNLSVMALRLSRVQAWPLDCAIAAALLPTTKNQIDTPNNAHRSALFTMESS